MPTKSYAANSAWQQLNVLAHNLSRRGITYTPGASRSEIFDLFKLAKEQDADLTLFDPDAILDRSTFEKGDLPSAGIAHVFVNGVHVLTDGEIREGVSHASSATSRAKRSWVHANL